MSRFSKYSSYSFAIACLLSFTLSFACRGPKPAAVSQTSIVGGQIPTGLTPTLQSTVALVQKDGSGYRSVCSGVLIAPSLVLTAAHCVESNKTHLAVLFATADTDVDPLIISIEKSQTFNREGSRFFPNFDIAWVKLKKPAPAPWKPIELLRSSAPLENIEGDSGKILLAGFGRTASVCENSECMGRLFEVWTRLEHFFNEAHFVNLLVIGPNAGHGTCNGDSGGPAFVQIKNRWYLAGILNGKNPLLNSPKLWEKDICESGEAIYNFAGAYIDWIEESSGITLSFDNTVNPLEIRPKILDDESDLGPAPTLERLLAFNNPQSKVWATVETLVSNFKHPANRYGASVEELVTQPELAAEAMRRWTEFKHLGLSFDFVISSQKSNQLDNVTPVGELSGIKTLILDSNRITETAPLGKLVQLEELGLRNNYDYVHKVRVPWDFSFIANLSSLKKLDLSSNNDNLPLNTIAWEKLGKLEQLELSDNGRGLDLAAIPWAKLPRLKTLTIRNSLLKNIASLKDAKSLETLDLSRNRIESLASLAHLNNLQYLDLSMNRITDFSPLKSLPKLKTLKALSNLQAEDFCPSGAACVFSPARFTDFESYCRFASSLSTDDLTHWSGGATVMRLIQIAGVESRRLDGCHDAQVRLEKMKTLDLSGSPTTPRLEDLSPIAPLTQLENLILANNDLRDLKPLSGLVRLKTLDLSQNYIDDIDALSELTALKRLNIDGNLIYNLDPLSSIDGLVLFARDNPFASLDCPIIHGFCVFDDRQMKPLF